MSARGATLLGFDYGRRRIGVAVGNTLTGSAGALVTLEAREGAPDWTQITALIEEWRPARLVVGVPYNADGSRGDLAEEALRFSRRLFGRYDIPVDTIDESFSSADAADRLRTSRREGRRPKVDKPALDSAAAAVILQSWLENHG